MRYIVCFGLGPGDPRWLGWFDQSRYLRSTSAFAHLDFSAAAHWYPLAYPLLAAPFAVIHPQNPYILLDPILFALALLGFRRAMAATGLGRWAVPAFLAGMLGQAKIAKLSLDPWTTNLTTALIWWWLALATRLADRDDPRACSRGRLFSIGLLAGALPVVRPPSVVAAFVGGIGVLLLLHRRDAVSAKHILALAGGAAVVPVAYLVLHLAIYGPHPTPYMIAASGTGFAPADLLWKAYTLLVTAAPWYPDSPSIAQAAPWTAIGLAGLTGATLASSGTMRAALLLMLAVALADVATMLSYVDLVAPGLWRFGNAHYFAWLFPLLGAGAAMACRMAARPEHRKAAAIGIACVAAIPCVRLVPVPASPDRPARMLLFRSAGDRPWDAAYFAPATLFAAGRTYENINDFHQMADAGGVREIASRGLIPPGATRTDRGDPLARAGGQRPYARYRVGLSVATTCMIAPGSCAVR